MPKPPPPNLTDVVAKAPPPPFLDSDTEHHLSSSSSGGALNSPHELPGENDAAAASGNPQPLVPPPTLSANSEGAGRQVEPSVPNEVPPPPDEPAPFRTNSPPPPPADYGWQGWESQLPGHTPAEEPSQQVRQILADAPQQWQVKEPEAAPPAWQPPAEPAWQPPRPVQPATVPHAHPPQCEQTPFKRQREQTGAEVEQATQVHPSQLHFRQWRNPRRQRPKPKAARPLLHGV